MASDVSAVVTAFLLAATYDFPTVRGSTVPAEFRLPGLLYGVESKLCFEASLPVAMSFVPYDVYYKTCNADVTKQNWVAYNTGQISTAGYCIEGYGYPPNYINLAIYQCADVPFDTTFQYWEIQTENAVRSTPFRLRLGFENVNQGGECLVKEQTGNRFHTATCGSLESKPEQWLSWIPVCEDTTTRVERVTLEDSGLANYSFALNTTFLYDNDVHSCVHIPNQPSLHRLTVYVAQAPGPYNVTLFFGDDTLCSAAGFFVQDQLDIRTPSEKHYRQHCTLAVGIQGTCVYHCTEQTHLPKTCAKLLLRMRPGTSELVLCDIQAAG